MSAWNVRQRDSVAKQRGPGTCSPGSTVVQIGCSTQAHAVAASARAAASHASTLAWHSVAAKRGRAPCWWHTSAVGPCAAASGMTTAGVVVLAAGVGSVGAVSRRGSEHAVSTSIEASVKRLIARVYRMSRQGRRALLVRGRFVHVHHDAIPDQRSGTGQERRGHTRMRVVHVVVGKRVEDRSPELREPRGGQHGR